MAAAFFTIAMAIFSLLAKHGLDMKGKEKYREMWGSFTLSVTPGAFFWLYAMHENSEVSTMTRSTVLFIAGALLGGCTFAYSGYVLSDVAKKVKRPAPSASPGLTFAQASPSTIDQSVKSYNQSGGITANTVNIGPNDRNLDGSNALALKQQILSQLPKDKEITVTSVLGDAEAFAFANQIAKFLKDNGFKVSNGSVVQGAFSQPIKGLVYDKATENFIVGAR